jgi:hypothetical protein
LSIDGTQYRAAGRLGSVDDSTFFIEFPFVLPLYLAIVFSVRLGHLCNEGSRNRRVTLIWEVYTWETCVDGSGHSDLNISTQEMKYRQS